MTATERFAGPSTQFVAFLRLAAYIDRRPGLALPVWIAAYIEVFWKAAHRPLQYDELFSYYTAKSQTMAEFAGRVLFDVNPPLNYLLVRASLILFGDSPFAARLPSLLGFLAAGLIVYRMVTRRLGGGLGLAALGIFWSSSLTVYAVWARPYGLLLGLFSIATLCWLNATCCSRLTKWHVGLAATLGAMFLTHCFSPPFAAAIGAGELVRTIVARRIDKRIWAALIAPLAVLPVYIPLVKNAQSVIYPRVYAASLLTIPKSYLAILAPVLPAIALIVVLWLAAQGKRVRWGDVAHPYEIAFAVAAFLAPLVTICYCMRTAAPFWIRYGVGSILGGTLILAYLLAAATKRNSSLAVAASGMILALFCVTKAGAAQLLDSYEDASTAYRTVRSDLPLVAANGMTFLEMDQREGSAVTGRLYYLTDMESAVRNHSTIFEEVFPQVRKWFPVRAKIEPYHEFLRRNRQFLVLATRGFPEDWLLGKLESDGAQVRLVLASRTGYHDRELYEVTLQGQEIAPLVSRANGMR